MVQNNPDNSEKQREEFIINIIEKIFNMRQTVLLKVLLLIFIQSYFTIRIYTLIQGKSIYALKYIQNIGENLIMLNR